MLIPARTLTHRLWLCLSTLFLSSSSSSLHCCPLLHLILSLLPHSPLDHSSRARCIPLRPLRGVNFPCGVGVGCAPRGAELLAPHKCNSWHTHRHHLPPRPPRWVWSERTCLGPELLPPGSACPASGAGSPPVEVVAMATRGYILRYTAVNLQ